MANQQNNPQQTNHPGGDTQFWQDDRVQRYDYQQQLLSEKKEDVQINIARIVNYFCQLHSIGEPIILDVGCGPGTPMTLSTHILGRVPRSVLVGVDSSEQMVDAAKANLIPQYGQRFSSFVSDFNSDSFWIPEIDNQYDFIVSSGTLHYLSDKRRRPFIGELFNHIKDKGVFVCCLANYPTVPEINEMVRLFRVEFTYSQLREERRPDNFDEFKEMFEETDRMANINWQNPKVWLDAIHGAGFKGVDIVWHLWVRSIFVAMTNGY